METKPGGIPRAAGFGFPGFLLLGALCVSVGGAAARPAPGVARPAPLEAATGPVSALGAASPVNAALARAAPPPAPRSFLPLVGGIQVNEPDHGRWVRSVAAAGLNAVQVTLYARQQAWDGPELYWERESPWVVAELRAARAAGLRTVLVMRVALEHGLPENRHLWHGMIWPRDDVLETWERRYRDFVLHGARLAAAEGVDLFVVGNELTSMTSTRPLGRVPDLYRYFLDPSRTGPVREALAACAREVRAHGGGEDLVHLDGGRYPDLEAMLVAEEDVRRRWVRTVLGGDGTDLTGFDRRRSRHEDFWRQLVVDVRKIYSGAVSYGANFDQYMNVGFWDELDALAVTGYFPLSVYGEAEGGRAHRMEQAWRDTARRLTAAGGDLPVVLLELGWTRKSGATVRPYSYDRVEVLETSEAGAAGLRCVHWASQPDDPRERVAAMAALARVVAEGQFASLHGVLLWKLTTQQAHRAIEPFAVVLGPTASAGAEDRELLTHAAAIADILDSRMALLRTSVGHGARTGTRAQSPLP